MLRSSNWHPLVHSVQRNDITYIFHHDRALPRPPVSMLDPRKPLLGIELQDLRRHRESTLSLDILVWDILDFEGDPNPLGEGAE